MKLSLSFLHIRMGQDRSSLELNNCSNPFFKKAELYHSSCKPESDTLYVCSGQDFLPPAHPADKIDNVGFLFAGKPEIVPEKFPYLIFHSETDREALCNEVNRHFAFFQEWGERVLSSALNRDSLEEIMQLLNEVTPNPWYFADSSYRVLAAKNAPEVEELSYLWRFLYRNRHLPLKIILEMDKIGKIEQMSVRRRAYIPTVEPFSIPFVSKSIYSAQGFIGHFYIIGVYTRLSSYEIEIADYFGDVLNQLIASDNKYMPVLGRYYDNYFIDLIREVPLENGLDVLEEVFRLFRWENDDSLVVIVLSSDRKQSAVSVRNKIMFMESRLNARGFLFEDHIAAVLNLSGKRRAETNAAVDPENLLRPVISEFKCFVGISEVFQGTTGLQQMSVWYQQAVFALSCAENAGKERTFRFSSAALPFFRKTVGALPSIRVFRHPALMILQAYDEEHKTALLRTLRVYLENERNSLETAAILYIHRNTLTKRLKKIEQLTSINLDDTDTRCRILLSFILEEE